MTDKEYYDEQMIRYWEAVRWANYLEYETGGWGAISNTGDIV